MSVLFVAFVALGIGLLLTFLLSIAGRRDRWRQWQDTLVEIRTWIEAAEDAIDEREIEPMRLALLRDELEVAKSDWRQLQKLVHEGDVDSDESARLAYSSYDGARAVLEAAEAYPRIGSKKPPVPPSAGAP
jgi:hypothetical protein